MELYTDDLLLRTVTNEDIAEVARMWEFEKGEIPLSEAQNTIDWMRSNHEANCFGHIQHLCFAVFEKAGYKKGDSKIIGWCGLDGQCCPGENTLFYMIDKTYRNRGYAAQCAAKLFELAFETAGLERIDGGCFKDNAASYRVMEKAGMIRNGFIRPDREPHSGIFSANIPLCGVSAS